ncbi:hypothetical protein [Priestia megaterium]|uniref:hypothetical protein n=1 Tax=Priestia megaterium TaxID=1404 RepID=UPI0035A8FEC1
MSEQTSTNETFKKWIEPRNIILIYFAFSFCLVLYSFINGSINGYFITTLGILSILFIFFTNWNELLLSCLLILGLVIYLLFQFLGLSDDNISRWNDILTIFVFNLTIFWALRLNKKRMEEKAIKKGFEGSPNDAVYKALQQHLENEFFRDMNEEQRKNFIVAINSLTYQGAPRIEDN